jgi:hypothetical protein
VNLRRHAALHFCHHSSFGLECDFRVAFARAAVSRPAPSPFVFWCLPVFRHSSSGSCALSSTTTTRSQHFLPSSHLLIPLPHSFFCSPTSTSPSHTHTYSTTADHESTCVRPLSPPPSWLASSPSPMPNPRPTVLVCSLLISYPFSLHR